MHVSRHRPVLERVGGPEDKVRAAVRSIPGFAAAGNVRLSCQLVDHLSELFCRPFLHLDRTDSCEKVLN